MENLLTEIRHHLETTYNIIDGDEEMEGFVKIGHLRLGRKGDANWDILCRIDQVGTTLLFADDIAKTKWSFTNLYDGGDWPGWLLRATAIWKAYAPKTGHWAEVAEQLSLAEEILHQLLFEKGLTVGKIELPAPFTSNFFQGSGKFFRTDLMDQCNNLCREKYRVWSETEPFKTSGLPPMIFDVPDWRCEGVSSNIGWSFWFIASSPR